MPLLPRRRSVLSLAAASVILGACTAPDGGDSGVVVGTDAIGGYNPVAGHGVDGNSPFYDGLLRPGADSGSGPMPALEPALATALPTSSDDLRTWRATLREGVTFSDGSALTARDVRATYEAVLDPDAASEVADTFRMIESIEAPDDLTVVFRLDAPTVTFPARLTLGILPAAAIEKGTPAQDWKVAARPLGTGPYTLESLTASTAVLSARTDHWRTRPRLVSVTYQVFEDTAAMASAITSGKVTGAAVPPRQADRLATGSRTLITARSADWRGLSLPPDNPFTADPAVRLALNVGADREALVTNVLGGHGTAASTPVGDFHGDAHEPEAVFRHDPRAAKKALEEAGWRAGSDGIREKGGTRARLTILYPAEDSLRADVAAEMVRQLKGLGCEARAEGSDWDDILPRMAEDAVIYAGGEQPYDVDHQLRGTLHSRTSSSGALDNPGDVSVPGLDEALDEAARQEDEKASDAAYRRAQRLYVAQPSWLILAFLEHTYIQDAGDWTPPRPAFEPHVHGSEWGPWWDLAAWTR